MNERVNLALKSVPSEAQLHCADTFGGGWSDRALALTPRHLQEKACWWKKKSSRNVLRDVRHNEAALTCETARSKWKVANMSWSHLMVKLMKCLKFPWCRRGTAIASHHYSARHWSLLKIKGRIFLSGNHMASLLLFDVWHPVIGKPGDVLVSGNKETSSMLLLLEGQCTIY